MTDRMLALLGERFKLTPVEPGEFAVMKVSGLTFRTTAYKAEGLGQVSVMKASGFFGLMKMDTLVVDPFEIDLPLLSYDRIFAFGNDTMLVELVNTMLGEFPGEILDGIKAKYASLPDRPAADSAPKWYDSLSMPQGFAKKGKKADSARFDEMIVSYLEGYLATAAAPITEESERQEKAAKAAYFVNGLLTKGGPSTDVFKKKFGFEKTREFFRKLLFGVA